MSSRVLITGLSSFTGPYLSEALLEDGYELFGLSQSGDSPVEGVVSLHGNLLDSASLLAAVRECKPDYVIHLGAITFVPYGDASEIYQTNVVGSRNLLQALVEAGCAPERVILASSANVYGNSVEGQLDEDTPFAPANDYAVSKVAMEYMARIWSDRLPVSYVRPFNYTGRGQSEKFLIPKIVSHFQQGERVIELGNTDVIRDFSDVRYVARAYAGLVKAAAPGEAYNICSGEGYSLKSIIDTMNRLAGYDIEVRVNPDFVRANEIRRLVGDNTRLRSVCPQLTPIPMDETLSWMYPR
ncbi:MAG: GDP-mannose 4,6-dehydratase [Halioglobus sp.]|nr:GDP-mannose 4,6-dehydratase [Halioglobus sp.]